MAYESRQKSDLSHQHSTSCINVEVYLSTFKTLLINIHLHATTLKFSSQLSKPCWSTFNFTRQHWSLAVSTFNFTSQHSTSQYNIDVQPSTFKTFWINIQLHSTTSMFSPQHSTSWANIQLQAPTLMFGIAKSFTCLSCWKLSFVLRTITAKKYRMSKWRQ